MIAPIEAPHVLGREHNGIVMTPDEFDAVEDCDRNYRYELIHGVLVVSPQAGAGQRGPNDILGHWLWTWRDNHPQGQLLDDTLHEQVVRIGAQRRVVDRAIWAGVGRQPDVDNEPPTVAVEFVAPGRRSFRRDYDEKRADYASIGVQEYWIIDRFQRTMTVFRRGNGDWHETTVREHDTYRTDLLPGFELPLAKLLAVADRYGE
jgi:Uma2 family endonuclease